METRLPDSDWLTTLAPTGSTMSPESGSPAGTCTAPTGTGPLGTLPIL